MLSCSHFSQEVGIFLKSVKTRIKKIKPRINENMKRWNEAMCSHLQQELGILYSVSLLPTPSSVLAEKSCWNRCFGKMYFLEYPYIFKKKTWKDILNRCYGRIFSTDMCTLKILSIKSRITPCCKPTSASLWGLQLHSTRAET